MRKINKIIIHCSASEWGNAKIIDKWHKDRGFRKIGYHYIILNGYEEYKSKYDKSKDGIIQLGRSENEIGAHTYGHNKDSLGICVIGLKKFTEKQFLCSLPDLLYRLVKEHNLTLSDIYPHKFFTKHKTCPNFDLDKIIEVIYYNYY